MKLEVRNSASLCSLNWLRTVPARTARVCSPRSESPSLISGSGVGRFDGQAQLRQTATFGQLRRQASPLDPVQIGRRDIAGDVDPVEAGRLEAIQARASVAHRTLQIPDVLVDQRVGADQTSDF